jgi:hypothetical protein
MQVSKAIRQLSAATTWVINVKKALIYIGKEIDVVTA